MALLEREHWLDALRRCPAGRVVLVSGEAGIGKTALVRAFCAGLTRPVLWGSCDALRTPQPLGPLHDIARQVTGELAAAMASESPRHAMFSAFLDQLTVREAVAVVEDAHWADEATLDLLMFAVRRISSTRGLLVITYRDDEVGSDHPLRAVLGALATDRGVLRVRLSPLSAAAVATLVGPNGPDAAELHARAGGNPFFVTEVLADPDHRVPETVRDAVLARAAGLGPAERDALNSVAVFPGYAPAPLVQAPRSAVDGCVDAGMLVRDGTRILFRHELARLAVEESIASARRTELHEHALAALTRSGSDPARLVYHAEEAGDAAAVLVHAGAAARRATAVGAHRQAADHYAQALRFADGISPRHHAELLERHGEACAHAGRSAAAVVSSRQAIERWRAEGDQEREAALMAYCSYYLWNQGRNVEAHAMVRQALALAEGLPEGPGLVAAYTWSAYLLMLARDVPGAVRTGNRAAVLAERFGEQTLLARALNAVGSALWSTEPDLAEQTMLRSLGAARTACDDGAVGSAMVNLGSAAGEVRRYDLAEHWLNEAMTWCSDRDLDDVRSYATAWLARCLWERGQWSAAEALVEEVGATECTPSRIVALTVLGRLRTRRGEPGAAEILDEAWSLAERTGDLQRLWPVAAGRAELARLSGQQADSHLPEAYELAVRLGIGWAIGELGQWLEPEPGEVHPAAAAPYRMNPVEAARAWDELGCPYESAMALAQSPDHLREALRGFEALGARPAADQVARRMRDLGLRTPRRSTLAHPDGLTAREADVLGLLRDGLRNSEIADRLRIAEKTAGHHVSSILAKLGVRTRQEAARHGEIAEPT
ncbi:ATP-binding protein [Streptomyces turgidiscabies]|uniref:Transcriptional regulator, LuxR family n=1 Tax=Streptomyces turgidiscabies (strain Car8) TaxID=698760 RepID=L7F7I0_STRT8|nr:MULTISPECIES: AAA family ATPase [Streptomyces]ELP67558.1 transcriptional regulator, LuxR family [Streptomyces turgidiscabies Car8]MDX3496641.1 AAA family ATPase [Streptomyces turgidiscabies]GAQ72839.1 transcriptional regulatory protein DevR (DosR) [Streptomyces turgidiscabies]